MIYLFPDPDAPVDQGDVVDDCPILQITHYDLQLPGSPKIACSINRVVVLTQTCDLANQKTQHVVVAIAHSAEHLVAKNVVKVADVRGPIRAGRAFGWYFLPAARELGLEESVIDHRLLFTVPRSVIRELAAVGKRKGRIRPLFREHLAKHLGDTYSRIGLPESYETE